MYKLKVNRNCSFWIRVRKVKASIKFIKIYSNNTSEIITTQNFATDIRNALANLRNILNQ